MCPRRNKNAGFELTFEKKPSRYVTLEGRRLPIVETGGWSNRHWNVRRREAVCPECRTTKTGNDAAIKLGVDLCPNFRCPSAKEVRRILRAERDDGSTKRYPSGGNTRSIAGGSRGVPSQVQRPAHKRAASPPRPRPKQRRDDSLRVAVEGAQGDGALAQAFRRAAKEAA